MKAVKNDRKILEEKVRKVLAKVMDPELNISITDLGLIYDVSVIKEGDARILMTLTSMGCPLFDLIRDDVVNKTSRVPGIKSVEVDLTFDPPWTPDKMSKQAKRILGFF